jgi:hypothetical protein
VIGAARASAGSSSIPCSRQSSSGARDIAVGQLHLHEREDAAAHHEAGVGERVLGVGLGFGKLSAAPADGRPRVRRLGEGDRRALAARAVEHAVERLSRLHEPAGARERRDRADIEQGVGPRLVVPRGAREGARRQVPGAIRPACDDLAACQRGDEEALPGGRRRAGIRGEAGRGGPDRLERGERALPRAEPGGLDAQAKLPLLLRQRPSHRGEHGDRLVAAVGELQRERKLQRGGAGGGRLVQPLERVPQIVRGGRELARLQLGGAQLVAERRHELAGRRLAQRALQVADRHFRGTAPARLPGRLAQHVDRFRVPAGVGLLQVQRDALGRGPARPQQRGGPRVGARALARREVGGDTRAHERMHEGERSAGREDPCRRKRIGRLACLREVGTGHLGREREVDVVAEDRHGTRERPGGGREPAQPRQRGTADRARALLLDEAGVRVGGDERAGGELAGELLQQERVAARRAPACLHEARPGPRAERELEHMADAGRAERGGVYELHDRVGGEAVDHVAHVTGPRRPAGRHERRRQPVEPLRHVGEPAQRRRVGPLQVVHDHEQRHTRREVRGQPVEPVQRRPRIGRMALGEHRLGQRGGAREQLRGTRLAQRRLEQLPHDGEGEVALKLRAAGGEHPDVGAGLLARGCEQPRLADARRPLHQHAGALPGARRGQCALERRQLPLTLGRRSLDWGRHARSLRGGSVRGHGSGGKSGATPRGRAAGARGYCSG